MWINQTLFISVKGKFDAVVEDVVDKHKKDNLFYLVQLQLKRQNIFLIYLKRGIRHDVLNAKNHEREAEIVANAGQKGAVTIATNMAGRGTDIKLGDGVEELGGLAVIGTERHESRRIDDQLRGRSGRQGDRGDSRFYLSLQDELMVRFGSERLQKMMNRLGMDDSTPIESRMVSRAVESAQNVLKVTTSMRVNVSLNMTKSYVNNVKLSIMNVTKLSTVRIVHKLSMLCFVQHYNVRSIIIFTKMTIIRIMLHSLTM